MHLSLSAVIGGQVRSVPIDRVEGSATLTYAGLASALGRGLPSGVAVSITPAADAGDVVAHLTGPFGVDLARTVAVPTVRDGRLQLGAFLQRFASIVPGGVASGLTIALPALPYGLMLGSATARPDGIHFTVSGRNVTVPTTGG